MTGGWRALVFALSLVAFAALAAHQLLGLLRSLSRRPTGDARRALLEELLWVLIALGAVAILTVQALGDPGGG